MSHPQHPLPAHCPNCASPVHGPYCCQCGQETDNALPTLHEFLHEYLHHYVALEGKLLHTVTLLLKPGQLTLEFLAGRRKRYVRPLPLYVTISFLFFLVLGLTHSEHINPVVLSADNGHAIAATDPLAEVSQDMQGDAKSATNPTLKYIDGYVAKLAQALTKPGVAAQLQEQFLHRLPYAVFILMPLFAGLCALFYRSRRQPYGVHLLFTLHLHAFVFLVFLVCLIPGADLVAGWVPWLLAVYLVIALKRVHGGRWWPQAMRGVLLGWLYLVVAGCGIAAIALVSAQSAMHG